jgi:hypothetical protein
VRKQLKQEAYIRTSVRKQKAYTRTSVRKQKAYIRTSVRKHLHLTEAEVVLVPAVIPDVHVTPLVSETIITGEQNARVLETAFEGGAGFVQRLAFGQKLNDKDGEFLICVCKQENSNNSAANG